MCVAERLFCLTLSLFYKDAALNENITLKLKKLKTARLQNRKVKDTTTALYLSFLFSSYNAFIHHTLVLVALFQ